MADVSILAAELLVDDKKAAAALLQFYAKMQKTNADINKVGEGATFGDHLVEQFEKVDRAGANTKSKIADIFSPENIVRGAAFAGVVKFLKDATDASFAAERANRLLAASATEAGKSYLDLARANANYARDASVSLNDAAQTVAKIQQLATFAGRPQDEEKLQSRLLDLASARGIQGEQLQDLIGTILSGQDEGLNRLGLADPSKLQATYAASIGKTVDALSQQEKVQAAVNAIMEKAEVFTGANADRLESLSGQASSARAKIDDLYTAFGQGLTNSFAFRDAISLTSDLLSGMSINISEVQQKLAQGFTPKQIAAQQSETFGFQAEAAIKNLTGLGLATSGFGIGSAIYDALNGNFDNISNNFFELVGGAQARDEKRIEDVVTGEQKTQQNQIKAAKDQADKNIRTYDDVIRDQIASITKTQDKLASLAKLKADFANDVSKNLLSDSGKESFQKQINELSGKIELPGVLDKQVDRLIRNNALISELVQKRAELDKLKPFADTSDYETTENKITDAIEKSIRTAKDKVLELSKNAFSAFDQIAGRVAQDNPFVKVLDDYDGALRKIRENTLGLKAETRDWLETLLSRQAEIDLFSTRLETALNADNLRDEANTFRNGKPLPAIDDPAKFFADYMQAGLQEIKKRGGVSYQQLAGGGSYQVDELTNFGLVFDRVANGGFFNRAKTFTDLTDADKRRYIDSLSRTPDDLNVQERLDREIRIIENLRRGSLSGDPEKDLQIQALADRKVIAITQGIDPARLNDREREAAASAREREAKRVTYSEKEAREIEASKTKAIQGIQADLSELLGIAKTDGFGGVLRIINEAKDSTEVSTVKAPTSNDTKAAYSESFGYGRQLQRRSKNGLSNF